MKFDTNTVLSGSLRLLLLVASLSLFSCLDNKSSQKTGEQKRYSFHLMTKDGKECLIQTDSLESGKLDPANGIRPIPHRHFYDLVTRNGYYFYVDPKTSEFTKYQVQGTDFVRVAAVRLSHPSLIENLEWLSTDTALVTSYDQRSDITYFARIDTKAMTAEEGTIPIPAPSAPYNWVSIGFVRPEKSNLSIGYTYHKALGPGNYTTSDTMYVERFTLPDMTSAARFKDTRSTYPGGINTKESYSFTDEKEDFYFVTTPGIIGGNHPDKPTAIFRIRKGEEGPDPDYFFNISAAVGNHGYGCWYLGKGKAIIRCERKDLYQGISDHYLTPHFEFYLIDLHTQTHEKLNLPLDKGSSRQCILLENGKVYITVNSDTDGCYVWIFNPETLSLKKGLQFTGEADYILRMDKM